MGLIFFYQPIKALEWYKRHKGWDEDEEKITEDNKMTTINIFSKHNKVVRLRARKAKYRRERRVP